MGDRAARRFSSGEGQVDRGATSCVRLGGRGKGGQVGPSAKWRVFKDKRPMRLPSQRHGACRGRALPHHKLHEAHEACCVA